tara:strand:- start:14 stop:286 length:273 start_codon:yes stop_codon:yes gene_type:complete
MVRKEWIEYEQDIRSTSRIFRSKVSYSGVAQFTVRDNDYVFTGGLEPSGSPVDLGYTRHDMVFRPVTLDFDPISYGERFLHLQGNPACNV